MEKTNKLVRVKVPQGFKTNINFRIVPGGDHDIQQLQKRCEPRGGGKHPSQQTTGLSNPLIDKLQKATEEVMKWMASDEANAGLFLNKPLEALEKAGVKLSRAEQKEISRSRSAFSKAAMLAPGTEVLSVKVAAFPKGKIGQVSGKGENHGT